MSNEALGMVETKGLVGRLFADSGNFLIGRLAQVDVHVGKFHLPLVGPFAYVLQLFTKVGVFHMLYY